MLTLNPDEIFADNYRLVKFIAHGGFADVWEAYSFSAKMSVALKIYPRLDEDGIKNIEEEYQTQADLSHQHLVIARYFNKYKGYPFFEMKYCANGNASKRVGTFSEKELAKCFSQIASALEYLHSEDIMHQDIKPTNILIDAAGNCYLADLGLSFKIRKTIAHFTQHLQGQTQRLNISGITPPPYRAPELYKRDATNSPPIKATDVWAFGATMFELITGDVPYGELGGAMQLTSDTAPQIGLGFSSELQYIISRCLSKETWDRPLAAELTGWMRQYLNKGSYGIIIPVPEPVIQPEIIKPDPNSKNTIPENGKGKSTTTWIIAAVVIFVIVTVILIMNGKSHSRDSSSSDSLVKADSLEIANYTAMDSTKKNTAKKSRGTSDPQVVNQIKYSSLSENLPGLYPQASERLLTGNDLSGISADDLKIMRNEIFARHGYMFQTLKMRDYFNSQNWYKGLYNNVDSQLSVTERSNIDLIKIYEKNAVRSNELDTIKKRM